MLPNVDHPEAFGQHPNADIASQIIETRYDTISQCTFGATVTRTLDNSNYRENCKPPLNRSTFESFFSYFPIVIFTPAKSKLEHVDISKVTRTKLESPFKIFSCSCILII